ncbi:MAG: hypothetical protein DRH08_10555 [Deltaproteobacteria bacterium]|nr:MAG: hypothetical protein DRH08_10555 [Deltaproteobacteria bacterium]
MDMDLKKELDGLKDHISTQHSSLQDKISHNLESIAEIKLMQARTQQYLEDNLGARGSFIRSIESVESAVQNHQSTLYGKEGRNGLVGKVNDHTRKWGFASKMLFAV